MRPSSFFLDFFRLIDYVIALFRDGRVAQLGEHRVRNAGVEGSNPFSSTNSHNLISFSFHFFQKDMF